MSTLVKYPAGDGDHGFIATSGGSWWITTGFGYNLTVGEYDSDHQKSFIRFPNLTIPPNAIINSAKLSLYVFSYDHDTHVDIRAYFEKALNPTSIDSVNAYNSRTLSTNYVDKTIDHATYPSGLVEITGLSTVLTEIIGQTGWVSGNAVQILLKDNSTDDIIWFDSSSNSKMFLTIDYTYNVPTAPSGITITRNSDISHTISWTNNPASGSPYVYLKLERSSDSGVNWSELTSLISPTATSYTDTSTQVDKKYMWRIRAYNYAGNSSYNTSSEYKTTPDAPTNVVATRVGSTVVITWDNNASVADNMKIERSQGPAYSSWVTLDLAMSGTAITKTDASPYAIVKYRVWASVTTGSLDSAKVVSNEVIAACAPDKPSLLSPSSLAVIDVSSANLFSWQHNPLDSSEQTKYSLTYRLHDGSYPGTPQYDQISSTDEFVSIAASTFTTGEVYYWKVKTKGSYADFSDWSDEVSFTANTKPTVTLDSPGNGSSYGYSALTSTWTFSDVDSNTQVQAVLILYDALGTVLETQNIYGTDGTIDFDYSLDNGTTYTLTIQVLDSAGLWSTVVTSIFSTSFLVPPKPVLTLEYDDAIGSCNITIVNATPIEGEVAAIYNKIYKSVDGGLNYILLKDNVPINTSVVDYLPLITGTTKYYGIAISATPSNNVGYVTNLVNALTGIFFFNSGALYDTYLKLIGDVVYNEQKGRYTQLKQFEGRIYPVKYAGNEKLNTLVFSCDLLFTDYDTLIEIIEGTDNIYYRDWHGRYFKCAITDCKFSQKSPTAYQFDCNITRLDENLIYDLE